MSEKPTCPNCGVSSADHAVVMVTEDMGACNACDTVWNESDKAVKRIRALEAERDKAILDAKMWKQVANLLDNKAKRLQADNARLAGEVSILEAEVALPQGVLVELRTNEEIARLAGELAEARATGARRKEAELMHDLSVALGAGGQECDVFAEIESLRARLAEAEKRVGIVFGKAKDVIARASRNELTKEGELAALHMAVLLKAMWPDRLRFKSKVSGMLYDSYSVAGACEPILLDPTETEEGGDE